MAPSPFSGRGCGDTRMWEMYAEYADIALSDESPGKIKARLSALSAFAESQGLTGTAALEGLRRLKADLSWELSLSSRFALFYGFVFFICRERGQKSLAVGTAVEAWHLSMTGRFRLLEQWCAFVQRHQRYAISEDTWRQLLEFSQSVNEDLSNYDPDGAWPVLVDDFVDSFYRKVNPSSCNIDQMSLGVGETDLNVTEPFDQSQGHEAGQLITVSAVARNKRCRGEYRSEALELESVNCIAQRLAEMSSPISCKRLRYSSVDAAEVMEGVVNTEAFQDRSLVSMGQSNDLRSHENDSNLQPSSYRWSASLDSTKSFLPKNLSRLQPHSQEWSADSSELMLAWPNLGCTGKEPVNHSVLASCVGHLGPGW